MKILVVGSGNFAKAFLDQTIDSSIEMIPWKERPKEYDGVIHTGSGRELGDVIQELNTNHKPFIQAATYVDFPYPKEIAFSWVEAPNLCLFIAKLFYTLDRCGKQFAPFEKSITESHQQMKKNVSDTAIRFAQYLDFDPKSIESIRDPQMQEKMGVPTEFLQGHAYHKIAIKARNAQLNIETKVNGREVYVEGAIAITKVWNSLEHRLYQLDELIEKNLV